VKLEAVIGGVRSFDFDSMLRVVSLDFGELEAFILIFSLFLDEFQDKTRESLREALV
jgi:hypothetical protein